MQKKICCFCVALTDLVGLYQQSLLNRYVNGDKEEWEVALGADEKKHHLGSWISEAQAACAYDVALIHKQVCSEHHTHPPACQLPVFRIFHRLNFGSPSPVSDVSLKV